MTTNKVQEHITFETAVIRPGVCGATGLSKPWLAAALGVAEELHSPDSVGFITIDEMCRRIRARSIDSDPLARRYTHVVIIFRSCHETILFVPLIRHACDPNFELALKFYGLALGVINDYRGTRVFKFYVPWPVTGKDRQQQIIQAVIKVTHIKHYIVLTCIHYK
eukprot:GHVU01080249.1.p1 GENE.GHVU01080249.1~~GHVU01080249.1.p1  ORF type:complete len:165 (-),score=3.78 GHVU01080249.1:830-1324(-)